MSGVLIVGASVAGVRTAQALRAEGYTGVLTLVDAEDVPVAYDKPPLSKAVLFDSLDEHDIRLVSADEMERLNARFIFGRRAIRLDTNAKQVRLDDGIQLAYETLVIATGARARPSPWEADSRVKVLRTIGDARDLRTALQPGVRVAVIGAGFIGAEVAASSLRLGASVSMIDPLPAPMSRVLNEEVGRLFAEKYRAEGITTHFGRSVASLECGLDAVRIELDDATVVEADVVVVGIGAQVNTEWLADSGLTLRDGVESDAALRAIGVEDVYAVGDVARWAGKTPGEASSRREHWTNAVDQARIVAHNIVHPTEHSRDFAPSEYIWSDQFDWKIHVVGEPVGEHTLLGAPDEGRFAVVYASDAGEFSGAVVVNWPRAQLACRRALGTDIGAEALSERFGQWQKSTHARQPVTEGSSPL